MHDMCIEQRHLDLRNVLSGATAETTSQTFGDRVRTSPETRQESRRLLLLLDVLCLRLSGHHHDRLGLWLRHVYQC